MKNLLCACLVAVSPLVAFAADAPAPAKPAAVKKGMAAKA